MARLVTDENFKGQILRALRRRMPELDAARVQDIGLARATDERILARAAAENRVLRTHDRVTMPNAACHRVRDGQPMQGVFVVHDRMPTGQAAEGLLLAIQ
ncbi:MAG TPA: hypothetical protein EYH34_11940, partial [Planctomycetes bacterium]|nr:hypothetical protein [Planctomycetota bacterium]